MIWRVALDALSPTGGIKQGDLLSPYMFVSCMKRLSQLISVAVDNELWKPIQVGRKPPKLSHLAFVDDLIIFVEASMEQVEVTSTCLDFFCNNSSEKVSNDKTRIFFSHNVNWRVREETSQSIGFQRMDDFEKYLEIKLHHRRVSRSSYNHIIEKVHQRLNVWKARTFFHFRDVDSY